MTAQQAAQTDTGALVACPFCASTEIDPEGWASTERSGPACQGCGASADTVEIWNTRPALRATTPATAGAREAAFDLYPPFAERGIGRLLLAAAEEYIAEYVMSTDGPDIEPDEGQRFMMIDMINGLFSDDKFWGLLKALIEMKTAPPGGEIAELVAKLNRLGAYDPFRPSREFGADYDRRREERLIEYIRLTPLILSCLASPGGGSREVVAGCIRESLGYHGIHSDLSEAAIERAASSIAILALRPSGPQERKL